MVQINTREIERKFLVDIDKFEKCKSKAHEVQKIVQGYLCKSTRIRIDDIPTITIKSTETELERAEYIYEIPLKDAQEMMDTLCEGRVIRKTRYRIEYFGYIWEVDVFENGLVMAELELETVDDLYVKPPWVKNEVTGNPAYYNCNMVEW